MRDPARIARILEKLGRVWAAMPDQRLGQLVSNLTPRDIPPWHIEDDRIEAQLDASIANGMRRPS